MSKHFKEEYITDTESGSSEEASGSEEDVASWISWFCSLKGNEFFCEVDEDYIQDDFNLSGLCSQVPYYDLALDVILDSDSPNNDSLSEEQHEVVETAAEMLYGLIHVRYILTARGMAAMHEKLKKSHFGTCPRVLCAGQSCLPIGTSDIPRQSTVKVYCPLCEECYSPRSKYHDSIDGAFFGTTFPHLLLMSYPQLQPESQADSYVPRVFGFKLSSAAPGRPQGSPVTSNRKQHVSFAQQQEESSVADQSRAHHNHTPKSSSLTLSSSKDILTAV